MELHELEVGELRAGRAREQQAGAVGAGRVGRARPQRRRPARREDHRARRDRAPVVAGHGAHAPVVAREQRPHAPALEHVDPLLLDDVGGELAQDPPAGRAPARVHDAADAVAALQPEREVAVAVGVEADAERLQVGEARRRLLAQHLGGRAAHEPASGGDRVLQVQRGGVVHRQRRGEAALGPVGGGLRQRAGGDERDPRAGPGGRERREQARRPGADHDEIARRLLHGGYGTGVPPWFRHDAGLAHDIPGHPERPARIVALEAEMERHDWFGWERVEAPRATRDQLSRVHPLSHVDAIAELSARGGGAIDMDTSAVAGTYEAALRAAGGAVALVDALLADGEPCGVSALRPPGHHAEPARAMGFCFFNNVAVAAAHARAAHGLERVLILDWDVHHGNGTNDIFHADPAVLFCSIHEWPLYPGTGPAADAGSGAGKGFTVNLPVPGGSGDAVHGSLVEHVVAPLIRGWAPELVLISAGLRRAPGRPARHVRADRGGLRGDDRVAAAGVRRGGRADRAGARGRLRGRRARGVDGRGRAGARARQTCPRRAELAVHPLAEEARDRLAAWWPAQFGSMRRM